jgi:hypothetical protein
MNQNQFEAYEAACELLPHHRPDGSSSSSSSDGGSTTNGKVKVT